MDIEADGNSNGRTILSDAGQASTISRIRYAGLKEVNTTNTGRPISLATADATPAWPLATGSSSPTAVRRTSPPMMAEANQTYYVRFSTANTTPVGWGQPAAGRQHRLYPPANTFMTFYCSDGTTLYEVSRSKLMSIAFPNEPSGTTPLMDWGHNALTGGVVLMSITGT